MAIQTSARPAVWQALLSASLPLARPLQSLEHGESIEFAVGRQTVDSIMRSPVRLGHSCV
jgi:hypothetical protein